MSQASIVSAHAENDMAGFPPSSQAAASLYEAPPPHPPVLATAEVTRNQSITTTLTTNRSESLNASTPIPTPTPTPTTTTTTIKNSNTQHHNRRPAENTRIQPHPSDSTTTFKPPTMEPSLSMLSEAPTEVDPEDHASSLLRMRQEVTPPSSIPTQNSQQQQQSQLPSQQQPQQSGQQQSTTTPVPVSAASKPLDHEASRVEAQSSAEKGSANVVTPPNIQQTPESPGGTVGSKRTATGAVKGLSSSLPNTPQLSGKSSTDKTRIVELSSTLKTRLSYAMLKVQQGWQTDTIDQVEEKYAHVRHIGLSRSPSMNMSPGSAQSDPQTRTGGLKREYSGEGVTQDQHHHPGVNESQISQVTEVAPEYDRGHQRHHSEHHHPPPGLTPQSSFSSSIGGGERTYESFWREHTSNPHTAKILAARGSSYTSPPNVHATLPPIDAHSARGLAPAAPIVQQRPHSREHHPDSFAARRRRVHPPPSLIQNASNMSTMSNFSTASTEFPITPTRPTTLTMEQDAVESLMFLSSPGHSQKAPSSQPGSQQQQQPQQPHHLQHQRSLPSSSQVQAQSNLIRRVWASTGPGSVGAETDDEGDSFMGDANAPISEDDLDRELDNDALHRHEEDEDDDDDEEDVYAYRAGQQQQQGKTVGVGMGIPRRDDRGAEASAQIHEHRIKRIKKTIEHVSAANRVKQAEQNRIMAAAAAAAAASSSGETTGSAPPGSMTETRAVRPVS